MATIPQHYAPARRRRLIEPGITIDPPLSIGEGWAPLGGGAWEWNAPTTEVNPELTFSGLVEGGVYNVACLVTIFTGTGSMTVTLGGTTPIMTFIMPGTRLVQAVAEATNDELKFIINTNATVTRVAVKDIQITRVK